MASPSISAASAPERGRAGLSAALLPAGLLAAGLLAGCAAGGPSATQACRIDRVADLPILPDARLPAVRATLEGEPVVFYIDTGAALSILTRSAADHFAFRGASALRMGLGGIGGVIDAPVVIVHRLDLGHGVARDIAMPVAGNLGPPVQGLRVAGLFGADFLSNYDVDLDLPGHRFGLYDLRHCAAAIRPLDAPAFEVPFRLESTRINLQVKLNGKPIDAVLDSGAVGTLVTLDDAERAGVTRAMLRSERSGFAIGIDESRLPAHRHRFDALEIGDETMHDYQFAVADTDFTLIGDDFLRANHVWISYSRRLLFVQPKPKQPR
ncbi:retroviral-like aspartic protease family protein [Lichenicoccus sp.]|uniref:retroviral-like aspartic protease family protein n=1 Tax=Lichenicoccus sp. TaxID=2781899 RepID=UPI003D0D4605